MNAVSLFIFSHAYVFASIQYTQVLSHLTIHCRFTKLVFQFFKVYCVLAVNIALNIYNTLGFHISVIDDSNHSWEHSQLINWLIKQH